MFGKKKESGIPVQHYEGIEGFATDYPCRIEIKDTIFEIRRLKPETVVTLPMERIKSISAMEEKAFMLKYHSDYAKTSKFASGKKYYLVVEYDKGRLAFWGTSFEYGKFVDLQYSFNTTPSHVSL